MKLTPCLFNFLPGHGPAAVNAEVGVTNWWVGTALSRPESTGSNCSGDTRVNSELWEGLQRYEEGNFNQTHCYFIHWENCYISISTAPATPVAVNDICIHVLILKRSECGLDFFYWYVKDILWFDCLGVCVIELNAMENTDSNDLSHLFWNVLLVSALFVGEDGSAE